MPLLDKLDETKLRSLKYGDDKPYIVTDINNVDRGFNRLRLTSFDDGLVRGGVIGSLNAAVTDTIRISKFLVDFPKGPLFITKQVGLQLSNPKLETLKLPEGNGVMGFVGRLANTINDKLGLGPTRIYNLGINTLAQIPLNGVGGHIVRHGLTPIHNPYNDYINVARINNQVTNITRQDAQTINSLGGVEFLSEKNETVISNNRLIKLKDKLQIAQPKSPTKFLDTQASSKLNTPFNDTRILRNVNVFANLTGQNYVGIIDDYWGGPGSTYGIGNTTIRRYDNTSDLGLKREILKENKDTLFLRLSNVNYYSTQGASLFYFAGPETVKIGDDILGVYNNLLKEEPYQLPKNQVSYSPNKKVEEVSKIQKSLGEQMKGRIFGKPNSASLNGVSGRVEEVSFQRGEDGKMIVINTNIGFSDNPVEYTNSYGEKVSIKNADGSAGTYSQKNREVRVGSGRKDQINQIPLIYDSKPVSSITVPEANGTNKTFTTRDLVKFRFEGIDSDSPENSVWMYFRSYLKSFKDNYSADWNRKKYFGRGETFFRYNGFDREISFSFKVAALSKEEMEPMYQKLNFLASNMAPDYSEQGLMRGPLMRLTIGNYLYREPGVIRSLSYDISDETPWEIAIDEPEGGLLMYELPHIIEVSVSFTPIHKFLPQKSISDSPFIIYKAEEEVTGRGAEGVENPWLKQKSNGSYVNDKGLTAHNPDGTYSKQDK